MPVTFSQPDDKLLALLVDAMARWHQPLKAAAVKVGVLMASSSSDSPAVKHGGYPAAATIRVVPLKLRLNLSFDAEMTVDDLWWRGAADADRIALIDHELSHLQLMPAKLKKGEPPPENYWQTDDYGRPKLKTRKGDWNAGDGFQAVIERHGERAMELNNVEHCYNQARAAAQKSRESHLAAKREGREWTPET